MLTLYRAALSIRSQILAPNGSAELRWLDEHYSTNEVIAYARDVSARATQPATFVSITNFGSEPVTLPPGELLLFSSPNEDANGSQTTGTHEGQGLLAQDTTAWLLT